MAWFDALGKFLKLRTYLAERDRGLQLSVASLQFVELGGQIHAHHAHLSLKAIKKKTRFSILKQYFKYGRANNTYTTNMWRSNLNLKLFYIDKGTPRLAQSYPRRDSKIRLYLNYLIILNTEESMYRLDSISMLCKGILFRWLMK